VAEGTPGTRTEPDGADARCPFCGGGYRWDDGRRCWACDSPSCEHCVTAGKQPLCPECAAADELPPEDVAPMLATLAELPADPDRWAFELKWDGVRCLARWDGARLTLQSRAGNGITATYPELAGIARALAGTPPLLLDGEIVALDAQGRPSFRRLQRRMHLSAEAARAGTEHTPVHYFVFDLLFADHEPLTARAYQERRAMLADHLPAHACLHLPPSEPAAGEAMLAVARAHRLEGVVAKRLDSPYEPGRRSPAWRKIKLVHAQELVIGGWLAARGAAHQVGSLLLGVYDDRGRLRYAGRAGTGYTRAERRELRARLLPLERASSPFDLPRPVPGAHYAEPRLVAQVTYRRWPDGGRVQQASYQGLRADVPPEDVVRERPAG